jgi:hypothetical protein
MWLLIGVVMAVVMAAMAIGTCNALYYVIDIAVTYAHLHAGWWVGNHLRHIIQIAAASPCTLAVSSPSHTIANSQMYVLLLLLLLLLLLPLVAAR